jgi:hypothetical protein
MAKLFPGIFYAMPFAIPGWVIGALIASSRFREMPIGDLMPILVRGSVFFFMWFGVITLIYGAAVWFLLRLVGLLNLVSLVVVAILPLVGYILWSIATRGYDSGWTGILAGFGMPALFIAAALWWFTVGSPRNV